MRYRLGRSHQDIVYRQLGDEPSDEDPRVAVFMDAIDAIAVVALLNGDDRAPADEPVSVPPPGEIKLIDYGPHPYGLGTIESVTPAGEPAPVPPPVDALLNLVDDLGSALLHDDGNAIDRARGNIVMAARDLWASGVAEGRRQRDEEIRREVFTSARLAAEAGGFAAVPERVVASYTRRATAYEEGIFDAGIAEGRRLAGDPMHDRCPSTAAASRERCVLYVGHDGDHTDPTVDLTWPADERTEAPADLVHLQFTARHLNGTQALGYEGVKRVLDQLGVQKAGDTLVCADPDRQEDGYALVRYSMPVRRRA